jgi:hypothetical protein
MATTAEIRAWAREAGVKVGERGRIHPDVIKAYEDAHGGEKLLTASTQRKPGEATHELAEDEETVTTPRRRRKARPYVCGFCIVPSNVQHEHCPGTIRNGSQAPQPFIDCACYKADHQLHLVVAE